MSPPLTHGGLDCFSLGGDRLCYHTFWRASPRRRSSYSATSAAAAAASAPAVTQAEQLYNDGKFKEAIAVLDAYLKEHPQDATALVDRGDDYEALDNQQTAIADYTAAIGGESGLSPMPMPRAASPTARSTRAARR